MCFFDVVGSISGFEVLSLLLSEHGYIYIYLRAAAPAADPGKESGIAGVQKRCGKIR